MHLNNIAKRLFVLLCLVVMTSSTSWAQIDPEGRQHALRLYNLYKQAVPSEDYQAFLTSFLEDPNLSKRAFLSGLEYTIEQGQQDQSTLKENLTFLAVLAELANENFQDPVPKQILKEISESNKPNITQFEDYAAALYSGYRSQPRRVVTGVSVSPAIGPKQYGFNKVRASDFPKEELQYFVPFYTKHLRILSAIGFADPEMMVQELDTYEIVLDEALKSIKARYKGKGTELITAMEQTRVSSRIAKLIVMAEIGLLNEFDSGAKSLMKKDKNVNNQLGLLATGFRVAYRQGNMQQARSYTADIQNKVNSGSDDVSPIFSYISLTAQHQIKAATGPVTPEQTVKDFYSAWSALQSYRPLTVMNDDMTWYYGRHSTRYWVDRLVSLGPAGNEALDKLRSDIVGAIDGVGSFNTFHGLSPEDLIFHGEELQGVFTFTLGALDQYLYLMEKHALSRKSPEFDTSEIAELKASLDELRNLMVGLCQHPVTPGFPVYDLTDGNLVSDLFARMDYVSALVSDKTASEKVPLYQRALKGLERSGDPELVVDYQLEFGRQFRDLGRPDLALEAWKDALSRSQSLGLAQQSVEASSLLSAQYGQQQDWETSAQYAGRATQELQQKLGTGAVDTETAEEIEQNSMAVTELEVKAYLKADKPEQAMAALVQGQDIQSAASHVRGNAQAQAEVRSAQQSERQVAVLDQKLKNLKAMPNSPTRDELVSKTETLLASTRKEFLLKSREIRKKYSDLYTKVLRFDPLNLPDIKRALPRDVAVIQYFSTAEELYVFVVTKENFRIHSVPISKVNLDKKAVKFARRIRLPKKAVDKFETLAKELHTVLVEPIRQDIASKSTLVFIPSGKLNILPFAALTNSQGKRLAEEKLILELAKPTDFLRIAQGKPRPITKVIAFANPTQNLPDAETEGKNIQEIFPETQLFVREKATKANLLRFGGEGQVLHLATHGIWDMDDSLNNHLQLSGNEKLAQQEIFSLLLDDTSIVTLSACNTAMSDKLDEKYVASLAEAFWIAGSHSVLASLWSVDDESTEMLMSEFYRGLKSGKSKVASLQAAQIKVSQNPKFSHPYYWSGFVLFGDYR